MVRVKERYLLVNILYPETLQGQAPSEDRVPDILRLHQPTGNTLTPAILTKAIKAEVATLFGDYGSGAVERGLQVKYLSKATSTAILRISRDHYRLLWAALAFMDHVPVKDGKPCVFRVVKVSGTIRKVEEEAVRRAKHIMSAAKEQAAGRQADALSSLFGNSLGAVDGDLDMVDAEGGSGDSSDGEVLSNSNDG